MTISGLALCPNNFQWESKVLFLAYQSWFVWRLMLLSQRLQSVASSLPRGEVKLGQNMVNHELWCIYHRGGLTLYSPKANFPGATRQPKSGYVGHPFHLHKSRTGKVAADPLPTWFLYSQLCMFCSPHQSRSGIAHPWSNWFLAALAT